MIQSPEHFPPSNHHPFRIRKIIVLLSIFFAVIVLYLLNSFIDNPLGNPGLGSLILGVLGLDNLVFGDLLAGLASYFCAVTLLDGLAYHHLGLRASNDSDPKALLESERVNGLELDRYFETRKNIRFLSLFLAGVAYGVVSFFSSHGLEAFCLVYILSTLLGIYRVRLSGIPRPRLMYRDDRYYVAPPYRPFYSMDYLNWYMGRGPLP